MSHDSLSQDLLEVFWHHEVQKTDEINLNDFPKNLLLGEIWVQFSETFYHDLVKWLDISHICQFSKKNLFFRPVAIKQKLCNLILLIYSVAIFFKWQSIMGYNSETKAILVNFYKKYPFGEVTWTQFGPKLYNLLSYDLLFVDLF